MKTFKYILTAMIILSFSSIAKAQDTEEITLTTYYPAPYGDYEEITTDTMAVNRIAVGGVGMPTSDGLINLQVTDDTSFQPEGVKGSIYFSKKDDELKIHDGTNWKSALGASGTPAGAIMAFAMNSAPTGWLVCNGATLRIADYSDLFNAIGITYGGNGTATFILPDLRDEFIRGSSNTRIVGSTEEHQSNNLAQVRGWQPGTTYRELVSIPDDGTWSDWLQVSGQGSVKYFNRYKLHGRETRPRNIAMLYCIKY
jgi:hypothetical protein